MKTFRRHSSGSIGFMFIPDKSTTLRQFIDASMFVGVMEGDWDDERAMFERVCLMADTLFQADGRCGAECDALYEQWRLARSERLLDGAQVAYDQASQAKAQAEAELEDAAENADGGRDAERFYALLNPAPDSQWDAIMPEDLHGRTLTLNHRWVDPEDWRPRFAYARRYGLGHLDELTRIARAPQATRAVAMRLLATISDWPLQHFMFLDDDRVRPEEGLLPLSIPDGYEEGRFAIPLYHEILARLALGTHPDDGEPYDAWEQQGLMHASFPVDDPGVPQEPNALAAELQRAKIDEDDWIIGLYEQMCRFGLDSPEGRQARADYDRLNPEMNRAADALAAGQQPEAHDHELFVSYIVNFAPPKHRYWLRPGLISTRFPMSLTWADLGLDVDEAD